MAEPGRKTVVLDGRKTIVPDGGRGMEKLLARMSSDDLSSLEEDAEVDGMLKSLISAQGLQSAWQKIRKRLEVVEQKMKKSEAHVDRFGADFDRRKEVEDRLTSKLSGAEARLEKLEEAPWQRSETVIEDHSPRLEACEGRLEQLESLLKPLQSSLAEVEHRQDELRTSFDSRFKDAEEQRSRLDERLTEQALELESRAQANTQRCLDEVAEVEKRLRDFVTFEMSHFATELSAESEQGSSHMQKTVLEFVSKSLVNPLQDRVAKLDERVIELCNIQTRQKDDLTRKIQGTDKMAIDLNSRTKQSTLELREELELRSKKTEVGELEKMLAKSLHKVSSDFEALQKKLVSNMNEVVDHFVDLQGNVEKHEQRLKLHDEEIENRTTKNDFHQCSRQLAQCAMKDEVARETAELKEVVKWQSDKIAGFGLLAGPRASILKGASRPRRISAPPVHKVEASDDVNGDALGQQDSTTTVSTALREGSEDSVLSVVGEDGAEQEFGSDLDISSEAITDSPNESLLRRQVEATAMGLVVLGHHMLREPKLGTSRNMKLLKEKELLEELLGLRHWITNRCPPADWHPERLTTAALHCAHPTEEAKGPLPQIALKGQRHRSADPEGIDLKMASTTSSKSWDQPPRGCLSARGPAPKRPALRLPLAEPVA